MTVKVTFTLDDETVRTLQRMAEREKKPQSLVVREAVAQYAARDVRTSEEERERKVRALREIMSRPSGKTADDVDRELRELRLARRSRGRRHPVD